MPEVRWAVSSTLKKARERIGFTPEEVAKESQKLEDSKKGYASIRVKDLIAWERGEAEPELEHLETLSEIYVCPVGYFFLEELPPEADSLKEISFRGLSRRDLPPKTHQTLFRFKETAEWIVSLIKEHGVKWDVKVKKESKRNMGSIVSAQRRSLGFNEDVRGRWKEREDAFNWWRERIESLGVFCFKMKLEGIRGASLWIDRKFPFILVNHQNIEAATGRLFTLLHEYGHLILAEEEGVVCDFSEPLVNRFAALMLLTYQELERHLKELDIYRFREKWGDALLDKIREPFFVSRDVVAIMLENMELAPEGFYETKRKQWSRRRLGGRGSGGQRPLRERKLSEIGFAASHFLLSLKREGLVSPLDLSEVLRMKTERVEEFFGWLSSGLKTRK